MGMSQTFEDAGWSEAATVLDERFALATGSHGDAVDYLVQLDHLLVILADGRCTGLARPGQFVEAGGNPEAPQSILLERDGVRVEIEPCSRGARAAGLCREHRLRLIGALSAA